MSKQTLRILLWAPFGSGEHYWGPGLSAYNLYKSKFNEKEYDIKITLVHGCSLQKKHQVYDDFIFIRELKRNKFSQLKFIWEAKKWINKNAEFFDVAHILTSFHFSFIPALFLEKKGIPCFIKIANLGSGLGKSSVLSTLLLLNFYKRKQLNNITGYIAISSDIKKDLIYNHKVKNKKIYDITNGVDTERFAPIDSLIKSKLRQKLEIDDKFTIIFCGGVSNRKNPSSVVRSVAFLKQKYNIKVQCLLVGPDRDNGYERKLIKQIIKEHEISELIKEINYTTKVEKYYNASDLLILPSSNEGMSNSLLEAISCGLPVTSTNISGSNDIIKEGYNGFFVENTPQSISEVVKFYIFNKHIYKAHSQNARIMALEKFDSNVILKKHLDLFFRNSKK